MRALVTVLVTVLGLLATPALASAQGEQVTIGVEPAGPVEVAGGATAEFTVLVRKHVEERIEFGLLIEKRGLEVTVEGCRDETDEHILCILDASGSRTLALTVRAPDGSPEHDEYHSVHAWVHEVDAATGQVNEQALDVAVATVVVPGRSPFRAPEPRPDDEGFVPVVRGRVVDSVTGDPVNNACLWLESHLMGNAEQACTGADGRYRFVQHGSGPVGAGGLTLEVNASGYEDYSQNLEGVADHALDHTVRLVSKTPPAAPDDSGPPVVLMVGIVGGAGLVLIVTGLVLILRGRSARAGLQPLAAAPAVLGQDVHVGSAAVAVAEAAGHQVVTTVAAGEQGPETSALRVGEAVSTHGRIHSDDEDQIKPGP